MNLRFLISLLLGVGALTGRCAAQAVVAIKLDDLKPATINARRLPLPSDAAEVWLIGRPSSLKQLEAAGLASGMDRCEFHLSADYRQTSGATNQPWFQSAETVRSRLQKESAVMVWIGGVEDFVQLNSRAASAANAASAIRLGGSGRGSPPPPGGGSPTNTPQPLRLSFEWPHAGLVLLFASLTEDEKSVNMSPNPRGYALAPDLPAYLLTFEANGARIKVDKWDREEIQTMLADLRANPRTRVRIEGRADAREGNDAECLALSERRAMAARALLVKEGIDPTRLYTVAFGNARPLAEGANAIAWAQNWTAWVVLEQVAK